MRKKVWGKNVVALTLSAALLAGGFAPINAQAESITEDILLDEENIDSIVADESTESAEAAEAVETTESAEPAESVESAEPAEEAEASEQVETVESEPTEETTETDTIEASVSDGNAEGTESTDSSEETAEESIETENLENPEENSDSSVTDGNADDLAVTDGNAAVAENGAFDYEGHVAGYTIKLHAEPGVVPADTTVSIKKVTKVAGQKVDDLVNEVLPDDSAVYDSASFDITLLKDGLEFEPDGIVSVEIALDDELSEVSEENDSVSVQVFHIEDNAETTEVPAEVTDNSTDVYSDSDETVVSYDAESFSVYNVSAVAKFETSDTIALENPGYELFFTVPEEEITLLADSIDSSVNVKSVLSFNGACTSIQEMGDIARNAIKARQGIVNINFKMPGTVNNSTIYNEIMPIIVKHTGVGNEGEYVRWSYVAHACQATIAYINDTSVGTVTLGFRYTDDATMESQAGEAINKLIKQKKWANLKTDFDKIHAVYSWMIANIVYEPKYQAMEAAKDYSAHSCYSAICRKSTVCQGYGMLFYRIMLNLGVDCRLITGYGTKGNLKSGHAWNLVQIGNVYYYVDSTWDGQFYQDKYKLGDNNASHLRAYLIGSKENFYLKKTGGTLFDGNYHVKWEECLTDDFNSIPVSTSDYKFGTKQNYIKPTSVAISQTSATIGVGATLQLSATCVPANSSQGIRWTSNDSSVATVTSSGVVTGIKNGEAEIFATSVYGGKIAKCRVLVTDGRVKTIEAAEKSVYVYAGSKVALSAYVFPTWAANQSIKYKSSNKKIATVNKQGIVTGKKKGKCTITCTSRDGGYSVKITVHVKKAKRVKSIKLTKKKLKLAVGATYTLGVKFNPRKATNKEVRWKSSKPGVVSVDANGNIVALKKGKAKITAISEDGKRKASCTVKVK